MRTLILTFCCLLLSSTVAWGQFWCWDMDDIRASVDADTLRISHYTALYNTCPDPIEYEVHVGSATIFVIEHTEWLCDSHCCADLEVTLANVPAGPWNIHFEWFDFEIYDWTHEVLMVEVPDVGQGYEPVVIDQYYSGCLEANGAPETIDDRIDLAVIKLLSNPTREVVGISVTLPQAADATVSVYDVRGRRIDTAFEGTLSPGVHALTWNAGRVGAASGIYYLRLEALGHDVTRRCVLLR